VLLSFARLAVSGLARDCKALWEALQQLLNQLLSSSTCNATTRCLYRPNIHGGGLFAEAPAMHLASNTAS
jgi:hypothetical protein